MTSVTIVPVNPREDSIPWLRQAGESEAAYEAFTVFRDAGPGRTVVSVGMELSKSRQLVNRWCQQWRWRERAAAFDAAIDRRRRDDQAVDRREAVVRHAATARSLLDEIRLAIEAESVGGYNPGAVVGALTLLDTALLALPAAEGDEVREAIAEAQQVLQGALARPPSPKVLQQLALALDKAARAERLAVGLPGELTEHTVTLQRQVRETLDLTARVREIIAYELCPGCRARVEAALDRAQAETDRLRDEVG